MSPEPASSKTKVCPTCGTRLSENATRCLVCGTELGAKPEPKAVKKTEKSVQASRMPEITLSLPAALGILAVLLGIVGAGVFFYVRSVNPPAAEELATPTATATMTATATPTEFVTPTPSPTLTPEPPFDYTVKAGESCSVLAFQFKVSIQSIVILNNLDSSCLTLREGQTIKIPWP
ncbi:MAG: LysM peptidoglycan-binding domain-containing protein, partial [Chloroflexota bacterium]